MLKIKDLHITADHKEILRGINLVVQAGEIHAIMGPNGSGKSTLAATLAGQPGYHKTTGEVHFLRHELLDLAPEERAAAGLFLAFQDPIVIPGVSITQFLKTAINQIRQQRHQTPLDAVNFLSLLKDRMSLLSMDTTLLKRSLNEGFSGGERKYNEILQMAMLNPRLSILDEIDSGLDVDTLKVVTHGINQLRNPTNAMIIITHYQRILKYVVPDFVHILYRGKIIQSGTYELAKIVETRGYDEIIHKYTESSQ